ncbi:adenylate/guanylate cyclase domain-containing protein [Azospirillum sp. A23]|uniref:adenylate/guanylate cyclase domain-containing protein n=1 Tax=Azospirillum sp. A23 TaxID=3160608 RepID=UPI0036F26707
MRHLSSRPATTHPWPAGAGERHRLHGSAPILDIVEWLAGDDCHAMDEAAFIAGLGRRLRSVGLPVDRLTLHLRTLHPEILGRTVAWAPNEPVEIHDREHGMEVSAGFLGSPVRRVMDSGETLLVRPTDPTGSPWPLMDVFAGRGLSELLIVPLDTADGPASAAAFGTVKPRGFSAGERAALDRILPALRNSCELRTLRQVELTLLDTFVGPGTARRILAGHIRRGQMETLHTALMLCDMRGFTSLSNRLPGARVLELLDLYFDQVLPAVADAGGEVLKFMGDAVLAFFPGSPPEAACAAALHAAEEAFARLAAFAATDPPLAATIALHYGEVSYGNIGSGRRLDFTLIGPDVNLVSRIQAVGSLTDRPLLMSRRFAEMLPPARTALAGTYSLKGFTEPVDLYERLGPQPELPPL